MAGLFRGTASTPPPPYTTANGMAAPAFQTPNGVGPGGQLGPLYVDPTTLQGQEFNVGESDRQSLIAQLMPYLGTLTGMASQNGTATTPGAVSAPTVTAPTLDKDNAFEPSAAMTQANAQAYGTAKSNTAAAFSSGLKSLQDAMASRGIGMNSGAAAEGLTDLYKTGETSLANESTAEAGKEADQGFQGGESQLNRKMQANETNASNTLGASEFNTSANLQAASIANQRLSSILGAFGSLGRAATGLY